MDNGVGFDSEDDSQNSGIGLQNIKNRAKLIGADFKLFSEISKGTTLQIVYNT